MAGYFHRVMAETPTRFWINNATLKELEDALRAGARCASTNPTYLPRLLKEEPDYVQALIEKALQVTDDENKVADIVTQSAISRIQKLFYPIYKETNGREGYVAIQGDPRVNNDTSAIIESAIRYREIGENIIIKVPATPAGADALRHLIGQEIPVIATLGFSVGQAVYIAEMYRQALKESKSHPICYVTFIAGVLDTYLKELVEREGINISKDLIREAGCSANRVAYRVFKERGYDAIIVGGGARGAHHFTELVGGEMAITIGWNLAQELLKADGQVINRIDAETPKKILSELDEKLSDFRKAYYENALSPDEFRSFGPVVSFQNTFLSGYNTLLSAIISHRALLQHREGGR